MNIILSPLFIRLITGRPDLEVYFLSLNHGFYILFVFLFSLDTVFHNGSSLESAANNDGSKSNLKNLDLKKTLIFFDLNPGALYVCFLL